MSFLIWSFSFPPGSNTAANTNPNSRIEFFSRNSYSKPHASVAHHTDCGKLVSDILLAVGQAIVFRGLPSSSTVRRRQTTIVCATPGTGTVQLIRGDYTS